MHTFVLACCYSLLQIKYTADAPHTTKQAFLQINKYATIIKVAAV